jgi:LysM repeat protein
MNTMFRSGWLVALMVLISVSVTGVSGQGQNLLQDPSFETPGNGNVILDSRTTAEDATVFSVPAAWGGWITLQPRAQSWMNRVPDGYPHTGLFKIDGGRSWSISRAFTTAMHQRVSVAAGTNVRGSARGFMERGKDASGNTIAGAQFRVGIDPNGGTDPNAPSIVWSAWVTSPNGWNQATVDATAGAGGTVTLFLYSTQSQPSDPNTMYWDDARLEAGGSGSVVATAVPGATPVPVIPTAALAPFVAPQGTRPDGSIVHIVGSGDTIDAIAVAYQTTRQNILDLNPGLRPAFIFPGQEIIVRGATANPTATPLLVRPTGTADAGTGTGGQAIATTQGTVIAVGAASATPQSGTTVAVVNPTATTEVSPAATTEVTAEPTTEPTVAPTVEPTAAPPTSTPTDLPPAPVTEVAAVAEPEVTSLCVWLFEDSNQNRIQEEGEPLLADGQIDVLQGTEVLRGYQTTGVAEPFCFTDLQAGNYVARAIAPSGFGLTTSTSLNLRVQDGVRTNVRFGAASGVEAPQPPVDAGAQNDTADAAPIQDTQAATPTDNLLQIAGLVLFGLAGLVLLGGIGIALFVRGR